MLVLVACEYSARVRDAFRARGHSAYSCDFLPTDGDPRWHYQGDMFNWLTPEHHWDLLIAHPPCTYLTVSGLHWNKRDPERAEKTKESLEFIQRILDLDIPKIALENPVGAISTAIRKPDQIIQPYEYGEDASKKTCLWLKGLSKLTPTQYVEPRVVEGKPRWANQTDSGQNKLGPSEDRWKLRSTTYQGIAEAMADQWS